MLAQKEFAGGKRLLLVRRVYPWGGNLAEAVKGARDGTYSPADHAGNDRRYDQPGTWSRERLSREGFKLQEP